MKTQTHLMQYSSLFTLCTWLALATAGISITALASPRQIDNLNEGWHYLERNLDDPTKAARSEGWIPVTLPHSWNTWDTTDLIPGYRRSASWYRYSLKLPRRNNEHRYLLYFEGAAMKADVYVDGERAGGHVGGYLGFDVDLTPHTKTGRTHEILVRVSNAFDPNLIPSQKADYFLYGGLTRDVWLKQVPSTYLQRVHVKTPAVSRKSAETKVRIWTAHHDHENYTLHAQLRAPGGNVLQNISIDAGKDKPAELAFTPLANPNLWSTDKPTLYSVRVELRKGKKLVDTIDQIFGYRWFEFREGGAFYLNGERLLLRGTHLHEDAAGFGGAVPDEIQVRDLQLIKNMGANFVRLGHYPHDPVVYDTADTLGLLLWDELPWNRGGAGGEVWLTNTERMLREQIMQNYNHPSIILWSLGNEIYWLPDFPGGGNTAHLNTVLQRLHNIAKELDPDRPTSIRKYYDGADIVDVFSPSIWSGWYRGVYTNYQNAIQKSQKKYPRLLHMEYGGSSHVGRHSETPIDGQGTIKANEWEEDANQVAVNNIARNGDWSESYIVDLFDWHLRVSETLPNFTGNAQWAFKDFGTPLRPENDLPYVNQKGLVDRAGRPKDAYYVFKSYWTTSPAFCWIESHTWTERQGPAGKARVVNVYCNTETARLFLNGKDLGLRKRDIEAFPASGLSWSVVFEEGKNELIAVGYNNQEKVATDQLTLKYFHTPHGTGSSLSLTAQPLANGDFLIEALMQDDQGRRVLDYQEPVYFSLDGEGQLHVGYGTPDQSQRVGMANGKAAIRLTPVAGKKAVVSAINQDFKGTYLVIPGK